MAENKNKVEEYYSRPEKLGALAGCSQFMWNGATGQFMGRTGSSWAKILLFYLIFYAALTAFFMAMWVIFASTLVDERPKYELHESIIGTNPGLGFRPMPPQEGNVESTLIWYEKNNKNNSKYWVDETNDFLSAFNESDPKNEKTAKHAKNAIDCKQKNPEEGQHCKVDMNAFDPCVSKKGFGYESGAPCIFLKLNKIYKWVPEYYEGEDDLPEKMPASLKKHIKGTIKTRRNVVWVSCEGENPADIDNLGKEIVYKSLKGEQGFLGYYFPFMSTEGYLQPLVAVQFKSIQTGVLINIECKAWAKNIKHDRQDRRGSVHFEIMIDEPKAAVKKN